MGRVGTEVVGSGSETGVVVRLLSAFVVVAIPGHRDIKITLVF